jgi:hypothetical protein
VDTVDDLDIVLPSADDLASVLLALAVPHEEINILVSLLPGPDRDPALWRQLEQCTKSVVRRLGATEGIPAFPAIAGASDVLRRYFPVYVFVAALPHVKAFHRDRGITDEISWHTLTDLGRRPSSVVWRRRTRRGVDFVADAALSRADLPARQASVPACHSREPYGESDRGRWASLRSR